MVPVSQPPAVVTVETDAPIVKVPLANGTIGPGYQGDDVTRVQQRLTDLGFAPGPIDGQFGSLTKMAVWAFEKLVMETDREKAKGLVTPEIWDRMQDPIVVQPRRQVSDTPRHTEIYLPEQVLAVFEGDTATFVSHISSGDNSEWCEEVTISPGEIGNENGTEPLKRGECGKSITPGGVYQYKRRVIGRRESRARRDAQPGVLQLRDRRSRRHQRAAAPRLARLHPDPQRPVRAVRRARRDRRPGLRVGRREGARDLRPGGSTVQHARSRLLDDHHDHHDHQHDDHDHGGAHHRAVSHHHRAGATTTAPPTTTSTHHDDDTLLPVP